MNSQSAFVLTRPYARASYVSSLWQLANTLALYGIVTALMFVSLDGPYVFTLLLAVVASAAYLRLFMIGHDCSHNSFLPRDWENSLVGNMMGVLTNTPFRYWARQHALHHRGNGNLDKRGDGDVHLLTVDEYRAASWLKRVSYRVYRNPLFLFGVAAPVHFVFLQRIPLGAQGKTWSGWASALGTNLGIVLYYGCLVTLFGWQSFLLVYVPVVFLSSALAVWLFYVQHQFPGAYFRRSSEWKYQDAAVHGSSFYDLPRVLHWGCANIGFHHIHHLNPNVPNYQLPLIHAAHVEFQSSTALSLRESLATATLALWNEDRNMLERFSDLKTAANRS